MAAWTASKIFCGGRERNNNWRFPWAGPVLWEAVLAIYTERQGW